MVGKVENDGICEMFWKETGQGRNKGIRCREKEREEARMTSKFWASNRKN